MNRPSLLNNSFLNARQKIEFGVVAVIAVLMLVVFPLLHAAGYVQNYTIGLWGKYLSYALLAISVDMLWGFMGLLSLGQALFFSLGGYMMGMYLMRKIGELGQYRDPLPDFLVFLGWKDLPSFWKPFSSFPVAMLMMLLLPGLLALVFGFLAFRSRVKGVYFSILTQALTYGAALLFFRNDMLLGGNNGFTDFKFLFGTPAAAPGELKGSDEFMDKLKAGADPVSAQLWTLGQPVREKAQKKLKDGWDKVNGILAGEKTLKGYFEAGTRQPVYAKTKELFENPAGVDLSSPASIKSLEASVGALVTAAKEPAPGADPAALTKLSGAVSELHQMVKVTGPQELLIGQLNRAMAQGPIYDEAKMPGLALSDSLKKDLAAGPKDAALMQVNRRFLEEVYPSYLSVKGFSGFVVNSGSTTRALYIVTGVTLLGVYLFLRWLKTTKFGLVQRAIRDSENRVLFSGYAAAHYKLFIFVAAALVASIGGALYTTQVGIINPAEMQTDKSLEAVVWVAVGGRGTLLGPIIGAVSVNALKSWATRAFPDLWLIFLGGMFILIVLFMPKGIVGIPQQLRGIWQYFKKRDTEEDPPKESAPTESKSPVS